MIKMKIGFQKIQETLIKKICDILSVIFEVKVVYLF